jgi:hypothetical protein
MEALEAIMAGFVAAVAVALFLVVNVLLALVAIAVRREDRVHTLVGQAPDPLSRGARWLTGVGRRELGPGDIESRRPAHELVH